ncbi:peptide deformylase [Dellaglioa algida]|uniref:peptide deformylase n=1 Tax=Dellaglioa algida TaxID=105612 RepID=UPI000BC501F5|nr:peptide deformylase [Dellaglioa algida]MDK1717811.1 peptide deformylase [Dellaglioa algida]MDK1729285.1 peptide deformylase [Dellaglioa algida]MDK1741840.1 peptide deformylase [Dellaglioa algida]SOB50928.1 Peptide deformylase [Dellaglioa algida]
MIKPIMHDELFLAQKAEPASNSDASIITDLLDTLDANKEVCVGMAANMIGVNKRIIVCQFGALNVPLINPNITKKSGRYNVKEGCLSLVGERPTQRYDMITVDYLDKSFHPQTQKFSGWMAQIIQHEVDHCEGLII